MRDHYHVLVAGPTTLGALLSSQQMGFRTRAINRTLRDVEALPMEEAKGLIPDAGELGKADDGNE